MHHVLKIKDYGKLRSAEAAMTLLDAKSRLTRAARAFVDTSSPSYDWALAEEELLEAARNYTLWLDALTHIRQKNARRNLSLPRKS